MGKAVGEKRGASVGFETRDRGHIAIRGVQCAPPTYNLPSNISGLGGPSACRMPTRPRYEFNRPGGNVTGFTQFSVSLEAKRLEVLREAVPNVAAIAVLMNPNYPDAEIQLRDLQTAAGAIGKEIHVVKASSETGIDAAFAILVQQRAGALLVASDPFFNSRRDQLVALTARNAIPAIFNWREYVAVGGLMSYGTV